MDFYHIKKYLENKQYADEISVSKYVSWTLIKGFHPKNDHMVFIIALKY